MLNRVLNIIFPEHCSICTNKVLEHKTAPICINCWNSILPYTGPRCQKCGKPLISSVSTTCGECLQDQPAFTNARSFGLYDGVLKTAINLMKYHGIKRLSKPLSKLLLQIKIPQADAIVPVPLFEKRLKHREFNQSALLAKNIAKALGITLLLNCLVKIRDTKPQVGLNSRERKKNIRKAFEIRSRELIEGKDLILIDDVFTTGATVKECSRVLKNAGAKNVFVITLAHGVID
jgi:ComF family protein